MTSQRVDSEPLEPALIEFISQARWFGGKGRPFQVTDVRVVPLRDGEPRVSIGLVTLVLRGRRGRPLPGAGRRRTPSRRTVSATR